MELWQVSGDFFDIVTAIQYFFKNLLHTDFTFFSKDREKEFKAHKLILAIRSPILAEIIHGANSCNSIEIPDSSELAIENMLRYIYDEKLDLENISDIKKTKKLAERFEILHLTAICADRLNDIQINTSNVVDVLETAMELKNEVKQAECFKLISEERETVFGSEQFKTMAFENAFHILKELRDRNLIKEATFLHSALEWLEMKGCKNKKSLLMENVEFRKISMDEFLDIIIAFPESFTNVEISNKVKEMKKRQKNIKKKEEEEVVTESVFNFQLSNNEDAETVSESVCFNDCGTNTENFESEVENIKLPREGYNPSLVKKLTMSTLKMEDGTDSFGMKNGISITVHDDYGVRSLQFNVPDKYWKGITGSLLSGKYAEYNLCNVDVSFEGLYYFICQYFFNKDWDITPMEHLEVLRAAIFFNVRELTKKVIWNIRHIVNYDPLFLDGLRHFPCLTDRTLELLNSDSSQHFFPIPSPNFTKMSFELLMLLLQKHNVHPENEVFVLLDVIEWLKCNRPDARFALLNEVYFEDIPKTDFKSAIKIHPDFFSSEEKESIIAYKSAEEDVSLRERLPKWYGFKRKER